MPDQPRRAAPPDQPGGRQLVILAASGAVLWLVAALALRALAPLGVYDGAARGVLYAVIVPGTLPFVVLLPRVAGMPRAQTVMAVAVALAVALLLDGAALAWAPWLYGTTAAQIAGAGATILWGAGVFLALALLVARR